MSNQEQMLSAIRKEPGITYQRLRELAGYASVDEYIVALVKRGDVRIQRGSDSFGRDTRYFPSQKQP